MFADVVTYLYDEDNTALRSLIDGNNEGIMVWEKIINTNKDALR